MHATCPAYLIPLGFMILMFVKSTNYKAPQPVMPTILGSNIVLRTLFSHVLSLCPSSSEPATDQGLRRRLCCSQAQHLMLSYHSHGSSFRVKAALLSSLLHSELVTPI